MVGLLPGSNGGEKHNMASDDTLRARTVAKMHRKGWYDPVGAHVETVANVSAPSHDAGRAKELVREMADADDAPVRWKRVGQVVMLEQDSESWVASWIRRHDSDQLPWDLESE